MKTITYAEKRFFEWHEDEISVTLRNKPGSYGGGSEVLVVSSAPAENTEQKIINKENENYVRESQSLSS